MLTKRARDEDDEKGDGWDARLERGWRAPVEFKKPSYKREVRWLGRVESESHLGPVLHDTFEGVEGDVQNSSVR